MKKQKNGFPIDWGNIIIKKLYLGFKFRLDRYALGENGGVDGLQGFQIDFKDVEELAQCKISLFVEQLTKENGDVGLGIQLQVGQNLT